MPRVYSAHLCPALGVLAGAGAASLAGRIAYLHGGGGAAVLGASVTGAAGVASWRISSALARRSSSHQPYGHLVVLPLVPWLAAWPLLLIAVTDGTGRAHLLVGGVGLLAYLAAWLVAGTAGLALWLAVSPDAARPRGNILPLPSAAPMPGRSGSCARAAKRAPRRGESLLLLALACTVYWNGAVLDPLRFRGFPDYVTQMRGAVRLLQGALPYNPLLRVWEDVNLPPVTLLLIFAPFSGLSETAGKLAYFALNQVAFFLSLGLLLRWLRPPAATVDPVLWGSLVTAAALAFEPWHDSLRLGQQNGIVLLFLTLSAVAAAVRYDVPAGVALAVALIAKPSAALLGLYFLLVGRRRVVVAAALTGAAVLVGTLPWIGIEPWRFYLVEKAPQILAGTPQQSNVALLALHARLFLPSTVLATFDAMPDLPLATALTRTAQVLGGLALWRLVSRRGRRDAPLSRHLEFSFTLSLSLVLVGHAWQSYLSWMIIAFVPLADPRLWQALPVGGRTATMVLAGGSYAALAVNDVTLHRVVGSTSALAGVFAALPSLGLLTLAFVFALLLRASERAGGHTGERRHSTPPSEEARAAGAGAIRERAILRV